MTHRMQHGIAALAAGWGAWAAAQEPIAPSQVPATPESLAIMAPAAPPQKIELADSLSVSPDGRRIAFSWMDDIWVAPSKGGEAQAIAVHPARELHPKFSPDGRELAFDSSRDDTWQIYTVPIEGGIPEQRTWITEGRALLEYTPDGSNFVHLAQRDARGPIPFRIYTTSRFRRGPERMVFDDYGKDATFSPDGRRMLFVREGMDDTRQGYRGSNAGQIWMYDLDKREVTQLVSRATGGESPMWKADGSGFYYLDGRSGCFNIWEYDLATGQERARTTVTGGNIINPAISRNGKVIVFQHLFDFYRLEVDRPDAVPERIELISRRDAPVRGIQRRALNKVWNQSEYGTLEWTADGLEAVFTAGGDVWVMDTVMRDPRPITSGSAEQDTEARFAPNGQTIYLLRDDGLGVNVWKARRVEPEQYWWQGGLLGNWRRQEKEGVAPWWQNDSFALDPITSDHESRRSLQVSPDGTRLAWVGGRGHVLVHDLKAGTTRDIGKATRAFRIAWSPDSRWLAAEMRDDTDNDDVWILSADGSAPPYNLSRNPSWDGFPAWSPDGRVLAFSGRTYDGETDVYYVWLQREEEELSKRDRTWEEAMEKMKTRTGTESTPAPAATKAKDHRVDVRIDFDRLANRVRRVRVNGVPDQLAWNRESDRLFFVSNTPSARGAFSLDFPVDENQPQVKRVSDSVGSELSIGPDNALRWMVDGVPTLGKERLNFMAYQELDWADYQRLGFRMIWRMMRDHFYDERMNNLDWDAVLKKYEDAAARAPNMRVFDKIVSMLFGELNASHTGFTPESQGGYSSGNWRIYTAHTGLWFDPDWTKEGWKVSGVVRNGPADTVRNRIKAGEIVRQINGVKVDPSMDPAIVLNGRLPRDLELEVADAQGHARMVRIKAASYGEIQELVRLQWIEDSRVRVSNLSTNQLGYLNIQHMNWPSLRQFEKEVFAEGVGKDGLIIDVRNNGGGFISDYLLAILCHPHHAISIPRDGDVGYPTGYLGKVIWTKPIVVLCNQNAASNAEIFSHAIKALGRGKLVGVPTQGSVISTPEQRILDLGTMRVPNRGWFSILDGEDMELHGVVPDYYLWPVPGEIPAGRDAQLDKAVEVLLQEVAADKQKPRPPITRASQRPAEQP